MKYMFEQDNQMYASKLSACMTGREHEKGSLIDDMKTFNIHDH